MGDCKDKEKKRKFNPKPKIEYPPVPTRKWIPPDLRPKKIKPPPQLRYMKPRGMDQRLKPSALRKIWRHYLYHQNTAILTGSFSQTHKRFSFKSNGLQTACNCALACVFAHIRGMDTWDRYLMDYILVLGDQLFRKSLEQDPERCWTEISTDRIYNSVYIGTTKVSFEVDIKNRIDEKLTVVNEDKIKERFQEVIEQILSLYFCGLFTMDGCKKTLAFWFKDGAYYLFDPTAHASCGITWENWPGGGVSVCYRCTTLEDFMCRLYENITCHGDIILESTAICHSMGAAQAKFTSKVCKGRFWVEPCVVMRVTEIDTTPPDQYEDVHPVLPPHDFCFRTCSCPGIKGLVVPDPPCPPTDEELKAQQEEPVDIMEERLKRFIEDEEDRDLKIIEIQELAPEVNAKMSLSKRPSWLQGDFEKNDNCKFPIPYKKRPEAMSFYLDIEPGEISIMRAGTHCRDTNFTKYNGRQFMGNAISSLTMLKFWKSKHWVPALLNRILKFGDLLYRDAMISIPRTQSLKLSNFQKKSEYMGRYFYPVVEDYVVVGKLSCKEFEVLDLFVALEAFLIENECCVIIGPVTLSVWVEDGSFYMFDPNERDSKGRALHNYEEPMKELDCVCPSGKACLMRFTNLKDLVDLYMENLEKPYRSDPFYLSKVQIQDWVDIPEMWYNFKGVEPGKWILRGTFHQGDRKFEPLTRNFQSPATSMVAMAMKHLRPIKGWQTEDVNELLDMGDRFYQETIQSLNDKGLFINKMLMLNDINKEFRFWEKLVEFTLEECVTNGIFTAKGENDAMNLYKALCNYFLDYDLGIVTCRNISIALWRFDDMFFYCDSHSRDDKGITTPFGTACIVRTCTLEDIVQLIMCNFAPNPEDYFNITNVVMTFYDLDVEGFIRPVIQFYRKITDHKLILRSLYSEISNRYELNAGKQTIPMCLMAIGYNKLKPSVLWNQADLDEILNKGDNLYTLSMLDILKKEETQFITDTMEHDVNPSGAKKVSEKGSSSERSSEATTKASEEISSKTTDVDGGGDAKPEEVEVPTAPIEITLDNVKKEFYIGLNKFGVIIEDLETGIIEPDLKTALINLYEKPEEETAEATGKEETSMSATASGTGGGTVAEGSSQAASSGSSASKQPPPPFVDHSNMELLILTKPYTVIVWKDTKMYYLFDPKPRDKDGWVIGQASWSELVLPPARRSIKKEEAPPAGESAVQFPSEAGDKGEEQEGGGGDSGEANDHKKSEDAVEKVTDYDKFEEGEGVEAKVRFDEEEEFDIGEMEAIVTGEEEGIKYPKMLKRSDSYWAELSKSGRACTLAFLKLEDLIEHIIKNIPPKLTIEETFQMKSIRVTNSTERKDILRPEDIRNDVFEGNWYYFVEVDRGVWILRGTMSLYHEMFPPFNRGKQQVMTAVCALAIAYTFGMVCYNDYSVDTILKYGDRLLTYVKKMRKKQMKEYDPDKLCDDELDWLLQHEEFGILDVPKKICISKFMMHVECEPEVIKGDVRAQAFEKFELVDVQRGVDKFFEEHQYGILESKDYAVAIWKGARIYYMFDGLNRGPNGITAACGTACITRYLSTEKLVDTYLKNLTKLGKNNFWIHNLTFAKDICPRVREPKAFIPPVLPCIGGCREIIPGKTIVRGSIHLDDPKFGKQPGALCLPIAFIALTTTLLHKTQIWCKPHVDEIIEIGNELYDISVEYLGFDFNPWEDKLDVCNVKHDFYVGALKANCEVRTMDQKGVLEASDPCTWNLRMGIQKFFEENTHGIIISEPLTLAIWEEEIEDADPIIYIFDPYPRGPTGMPCFDGAGCLIGCNDPRMAAAHICSCILNPDQKTSEYRLVPLEIVVGTMKTRRKLKRVDTKSSLAVLPRCTQDELNKEKRLIRKLAEYERKRKEYKRLQLIGRKAFYTMKDGDAIIRGFRSTNSICYPESVRNNQDIPMCIVALVMHSLYSIENWNYKNIDLVLDTGNQLYIDSYIAYGPKDLKLGPENIIRKFFLRHLTIKVIIYKPIISDEFNATILNRILNIYFAQEPFCMLSHYNQWVSLIARSGQFYLFDPHERDIEGNVIKKDETGTAVVIRFDTLERLVDKLISNMSALPEDSISQNENDEKPLDVELQNDNDENYENNLFTLWLISVEIK